MAKRKPLPAEEKPTELNMTPMIDVVFQLLIFFMLTLKFSEQEGKLLATLPKDKGPQSSSVSNPELQEVRITICVGGDTKTHVFNKGEHEKVDKDSPVTYVLVDKIDCGQLFKSEADPQRAQENAARFKQIGEKAKEIHAMTPSSRDPSKRAPIILDADSETPYEHIIGILNELRFHGIVENVEFAANPRFELYYGSLQKGQFNRKK